MREKWEALKEFSSARLEVFRWEDLLESGEARKPLEDALTTILTPAVLAHLPPSLHLGAGKNAIDAWISARAAESHVFVVQLRGSSEIIGLLIMVELPAEKDVRTLHLGYLLGESAWGKGFATELVSGLVSSARFEDNTQIIGGVDKNNGASARVLLKAGFKRSAALSTPETDQFVYIAPSS